MAPPPYTGSASATPPVCNARDGKPPRPFALGSDRLGRGPIVWLDSAEITAGFVGAALAFIRKAAAAGQPFYVNVWPGDVHSPFFPPRAKLGDGSKRALYHGVLETMDAQLGPLFDHLRNDPQLRENTLVLVCSDNGPEAGAGSAGPFRGGKAMLYEGGIRSPLIVWGPGLAASGNAGARNDAAVLSTLDLAPSLLALAGLAEFAAVTFDGENVADTLTGKANASRRAPLFWRRPPDRPGDLGHDLPDLAVREGHWKLLCDYDGSRARLYDLARDSGETTDLAAIHPEITRRLTTAIVAWHRAMPPDKGTDYQLH